MDGAAWQGGGLMEVSFQSLREVRDQPCEGEHRRQGGLPFKGQKVFSESEEPPGHWGPPFIPSSFLRA